MTHVSSEECPHKRCEVACPFCGGTMKRTAKEAASAALWCEQCAVVLDEGNLAEHRAAFAAA